MAALLANPEKIPSAASAVIGVGNIVNLEGNALFSDKDAR